MQVYLLFSYTCLLSSLLTLLNFVFYYFDSIGDLFPCLCKIWRHLVVKTDFEQGNERKMLKGGCCSLFTCQLFKK